MKTFKKDIGTLKNNGSFFCKDEAGSFPLATAECDEKDLDQIVDVTIEYAGLDHDDMEEWVAKFQAGNQVFHMSFYLESSLNSWLSSIGESEYE